MKLVFVTPYYNPRDVRRGSGTFAYMTSELERQGCEVVFIGPLAVKPPLQTRFMRFLAKKIQKKRFVTYLDPCMASAMGKALSVQLNGTVVDLILTNDPGVVAGLRTDIPIVYYSDVMLPSSQQASVIRQNYAYGKNPVWAVRRYQKTMYSCLQKASLLVFPADWQVKEALKWGTNASKIYMIPFGANIPDPGASVAQHRNLNQALHQYQINLLFIGRDWIGKGGDVALSVTKILRKQGIEAVLNVVGLRLNKMPSYVRSYGLLRKDVPAEWELMHRLFIKCDVLLLPSHSEGFGIAPREAAAYGMPTIAYRIGGLSTSMSEGQSGYLLDPLAGPEVFATKIREWLLRPDDYATLCLSARQVYQENYDWSVSIDQLLQILKNNFSNQTKKDES